MTKFSLFTVAALSGAVLLSACSSQYETSRTATAALQAQAGNLQGIDGVAVCLPEQDGDVEFTVRFTDNVYAEYRLPGGDASKAKKQWEKEYKNLEVSSCFDDFYKAPYLIQFSGNGGFSVAVDVDYAKDTKFSEAEKMLQNVVATLHTAVTNHKAYVEPLTTWNP